MISAKTTHLTKERGIYARGMEWREELWWSLNYKYLFFSLCFNLNKLE